MSRHVFILIALMLASSAIADNAKPLNVSLVPATMRGRSFAPLQVDAHCNWRGEGLLRGRLEMVIRDDTRIIGVCRTQPLALVSGQQTFRFTLPPLVTQYRGAPVDVALRFLTPDGAIRLDPFPLTLPGLDERSLLVGYVHAPIEHRQRWQDLVSSLQLERHQPDTHTCDITTSLARLTAEELPVGVAGYCAFDILVIEGEVWDELGDAARDTIGRWVNAGGSLCLLGVDTGGEAIERRRLELGRLVRVGSDDVDPDARDWRDAIALLWKFTHAQRRTFIDTGVWRADVEERSPQHEQVYGWRGGEVEPPEGTKPALNAHRQAIPGAEQWLPALMPGSVRMVPFKVVVLILLLFTLAIGPVDYFLLGAMRQRRLTWLLFPLLAIGFTALTVYISNRYMGSTDHRTALVVTDVGAGGELLRQSRFELIFAGRQTRVTTPVVHGLASPMDHNRLGSMHYGYSWNPNTADALDPAPPIYDGRIPSEYQLTQLVRQWQPRVNRHTSFDGEKATPGDLNWGAISAADRTDVRLASKLIGDTSFNGSVIRYWREGRVVLHGSESPLRDRAATPQGYYDYYWGPQSNHWRYSFLTQLSARQREGLFSLVVQLSPAGGETFEDLALLDTTDPNQWLLVAVYEDGDELHIVRRLYHQNEDDR